VAVLALAAELVACQRNEDATRALLSARESEWTSDLGGLGRAQAALVARLGHLPNPGSRGGAESFASRRAALLLASTRQSLVDIEIHQRQIGPRVEAALSHDPDAAKRLLEDDSLEMATSLQSVRERTANLESVVGALVRDADGREKNVSAATDASSVPNKQR